MTDAIIEAILKIANNEAFIKIVEPHVAFPGTLLRWQVERTLEAIKLLQEEYEIQRNKQSANRNNGRTRGKGVRKVPKE